MGSHWADATMRELTKKTNQEKVMNDLEKLENKLDAISDYFKLEWVECSACWGTGTSYEYACAACCGAGEVIVGGSK